NNSIRMRSPRGCGLPAIRGGRRGWRGFSGGGGGGGGRGDSRGETEEGAGGRAVIAGEGNGEGAEAVKADSIGGFGDAYIALPQQPHRLAHAQLVDEIPPVDAEL